MWNSIPPKKIWVILLHVADFRNNGGCKWAPRDMLQRNWRLILPQDVARQMFACHCNSQLRHHSGSTSVPFQKSAIMSMIQGVVKKSYAWNRVKSAWNTKFTREIPSLPVKVREIRDPGMWPIFSNLCVSWCLKSCGSQWTWRSIQAEKLKSQERWWMLVGCVLNFDFKQLSHRHTHDFCRRLHLKVDTWVAYFGQAI